MGGAVLRAASPAGHDESWARQEAGEQVPDFRALVGETAWATLPAAVQARFDAAAHHQRRVYPGTMEVRASWFGRLIAQLCRLIGTPIAPWTGADVPVSVSVWPAPDGALVWDRTYVFPGRAPVLVSSRKMAAKDGGLLELVRGGLGMRLAVTVEEGALVFRSTGYVWRIGRWLAPVPALLTPGAACVTHRDAGGGRFYFSMRFVHALAGETLFHAGYFQDPET